MAKSPRYSVKFRRRREGRTDYRKRLKMLQSKIPRLCVRRSNKYIVAEVIEYSVKGDRVLAYAHSSELKKAGWQHGLKNLPAAYLTGVLIGKKALKAKVEKAIFDIGIYTSTKGNKLFAVLKGAVDAGLEIPCDEKIFPSADRISGKHLKKESIAKDFEAIRKKIMGEEK